MRGVEIAGRCEIGWGVFEIAKTQDSEGFETAGGFEISGDLSLRW